MFHYQWKILHWENQIMDGYDNRLYTMSLKKKKYNKYICDIRIHLTNPVPGS